MKAAVNPRSPYKLMRQFSLRRWHDDDARSLFGIQRMEKNVARGRSCFGPRQVRQSGDLLQGKVQQRFSWITQWIEKEAIIGVDQLGREAIAIVGLPLAIRQPHHDWLDAPRILAIVIIIEGDRTDILTNSYLTNQEHVHVWLEAVDDQFARRRCARACKNIHTTIAKLAADVLRLDEERNG